MRGRSGKLPGRQTCKAMKANELQALKPGRDGGTISTLLDAGEARHAALSAPGRPPLTFDGLRAHVAASVERLNDLGIGRNDRVAIVLPNGPELASAFLAVAAGATAAPINPAYRQEDFAFYLADLGAAAVIVEQGSHSPVIPAAAALKVPVIELAWRPGDPAGTFALHGDRSRACRSGGVARPDDIALVLHTSGTTSRPKMVPLSQANLAASAGHIVQTLALSPEDRCLTVMPLFHIHGLVASVLAPLAAGGEVFCVPGRHPSEYFYWMAEAGPTWYTAVPTVHQAMLAQARENPRTLERVHLRFVRSSSAPLPPAVMRELESTFKAPVIEAYGMTEAAHQMTSNPLPPGLRKSGTVGRAAGPDVAVMDEAGRLLAAGATGEVVIRGPNVMSGYENNPEANASAFHDGWFRTGDEGRFDEAGYLSITGRLKEIINRGGQKISPREIDDALLEHPEVAAAATFPVPHPTLGEEIGAAVVLRPGATLTRDALSAYLAARLPEFKVPRRIVFVQDIPKGPTGKIQRRELAAALGSASDVGKAQSAGAGDRPLSDLEGRLASLWKQILGENREIGVDEDFFSLGGDSLQAVELLVLIESKLGHSLPQSVFIGHGTVAKMAAYINRQGPSPSVVPMQPRGTRPPFFCVAQIEGEVLSLRTLSRRLGEDQPFFAIQSVGIDGRQAPLTRVEDMAAHNLSEIRKYQPKGPYFVGGYSMGGLVAYEMARQLVAQGAEVGLLALIDAYCGPPRMRFVASDWIRRRFSELSALRVGQMPGYFAHTLRELGRRAAALLARARDALKWRVMQVSGRESPAILRPRTVKETNAMAVWSYELRPCTCDAVLFRTDLNTWQDPAMHDDWRKLIGDRLEVRRISGDHFTLLNDPHVATLASALQECLERAARAKGVAAG
jgi:oxalate---CoA ligase